MMILEYVPASPGTKDPRRLAGMKAEEQMAHYLGRAFGESKDVMLLHGLRLVDETQREPNGGPFVAQIDHLVLHRHGAFIVESKSCLGSVRITPSASGADEWAIKSRKSNRYNGMPSPLAQAKRQADALRRCLQKHDKEVLGKILGLKQRTFTNMPIQFIAAIGDGGVIDNEKGWVPPRKPYAGTVEKADNVCVFIENEMAKHRENDRALLADMKSEYGWWASKPAEVNHTARLLFALHAPLRPGAGVPAQPVPASPPKRTPTPSKGPKTPPAEDAACKSCGESRALDAMCGKFGYYWKCRSCGVNTTMPRVCSACRCADKEVVRIQKRGPEYTRRCGTCSIAEVIWRATGVS